MRSVRRVCPGARVFFPPDCPFRYLAKNLWRVAAPSAMGTKKVEKQGDALVRIR